MTSPIFLIGLGVPNPAHPEAMAAYSKGAMPLLETAGGRVVGRYRRDTILAGEVAPQTVFIMAFDDAERARAALASEAYAALIPIREKAFERLDLIFAQSV